MTGSGMRSPPIGKFWIERCVCAPQYRSAGTSMGPKVSVSVRVLVFAVTVGWKCDRLPMFLTAQLREFAVGMY